MINLLIRMERNGKQVSIGNISGNGVSDACFAYEKTYLNGESPIPISLHLPLQEKPFSAENTRLYFEGLLPEGFTRRSVARYVHADENDYLSILESLGGECIGAVQVLREGKEPEQAGYRELSEEEVRKLAKEGATKSTQIVVETHLSLAGASGKAGLYYSEKDSKWYLPVGTAPSTHIVKQSHVRLGDIVLNEQLCMMCAAKLGLNVPDSYILNTGNGADEDILFVTKRFDRTFSERPICMKGLPIPLRLHQEDFSQALGVPSAHKYEPSGGGYLRKMMTLLRIVSADPVRDQLMLWDTVVFHYLIGNTDGHLKNFSLLYGPDLKKVRLAPVYDMLSTVAYENGTRNLSISINDKFDIYTIHRSDFEAAAVKCGIGRNLAMQHYDRLAKEFKQALNESADQLIKMGFAEAAALRDSIQNHFERTVIAGH